MRKFILKIFYFIIPFLALILPLDIFISSLYKGNHDYPGEIEVWNDIYQSKINADIAIYGSSRAWVQFNPAIIFDSLSMKAYNFGIDGHNFWLQYLRHREFLKYNKKPKIIILSVDVFTLEKRKDLYQLNQFLPFMLWNKNIYEYTKSFDGFDIYDYFLPLARYYSKRDVLKNIVINGSSEIYRINGFRSMDQEWNDDLENAKSKMNDLHIVIDIGTIKLMDDFISECKRKDIQLFFVYPPEFISGRDFVNNRSEILLKLQNIAISKDIPFIDYSNDLLCRQREYFYNTMHLNQKGAEEFTKQLVKDIRQIFIDSSFILDMANFDSR